jgi:uncharacterized protein YbdZ (MbtH family)
MAAAACSATPTSEPGDQGNSQGDLSGGDGDVGFDADADGRDAVLELFEVADNPLTVALTANPATVDANETTELTATVTSSRLEIEDRTRVVFAIVSGEGSLLTEGTTTIERSTGDGVARVTFLPASEGEVVIEATVDLGAELVASDTVTITVTGEVDSAELRLWADLPGDRTFVPGPRRLTVTATVLAESGVAAASIPVDFESDGGSFSLTFDGELTVDRRVRTGEDGRATAYYEPGDHRGPETITATVIEAAFGEELEASLELDVLEPSLLGTLAYRGMEPDRLGVAPSEYNVTGSARFRLTDGDGEPWTGQSVQFELITSIDADLAASLAVTDDDGEVSVTVEAGDYAGPFEIIARLAVEESEIRGVGDRHWVVTTRPVGRLSTLSCTPSNIAGFVGAEEGEGPGATANCVGTLRDRFGWGVPVAHEVSLAAEVGLLPESVTSDSEGAFEFQWTIEELPLDVDPFDDRIDHEPAFARADGGIANIRDHVARVVFYVEGEEYFIDHDDNGIRTAGEVYWDQDEPFVDADDTGRREEGETFVDAPWGLAASYDAGNEVWDRETVIWGEAVVVLSGEPSVDETPEGSDRTTFSYWKATSDIPAGGSLVVRDGVHEFFELILADRVGAPINSSAEVEFSLSGCGGDVSLESDVVVPVADELGFILASVQTPIPVGWQLRSLMTQFTGGAPVEVELFNPTGGEAVDCNLTATITFASCPVCEDYEVVETVLSLEVL